MGQYLEKFKGTINKRQSDQILKLLSKQRNSGQIRTVEEFTEKLENVSVVVEDYPNQHQLKKVGTGGMLLGLYEGVPKTKRGRYGIGATLPDKITIFKIPILAISRSIEQLKENVRNTVIHEIAHHFGMSEARIRHRNH